MKLSQFIQMTNLELLVDILDNTCKEDRQYLKENIKKFNKYFYFLKIIFALKENDLLSPSTLNGYAVCIK